MRVSLLHVREHGAFGSDGLKAVRGMEESAGHSGGPALQTGGHVSQRSPTLKVVRSATAASAVPYNLISTAGRCRAIRDLEPVPEMC
jgi:hypothetical protein